MIGLSKKLLINLPIRLKGKFEKHFWQIKESVGGPEQGSRLCFAEVTNWGQITSGMQARVWVGTLYILYRDIPQDSGQIINTFFQPLGPQKYSIHCEHIIWLQQYMCSDWLFSCNDQAILARCPRYIQSVFNLLVDILMDIYVMVD